MEQDVIEALIDPAELVDGQLTALRVGPAGAEIDVLALRRGPVLKVWHNACPHAGRRLDYAPGRFLMQDERLVCAAHGAQFELDEGRCVEGPGRGGGLAALALSPAGTAWAIRWRSA